MKRRIAGAIGIAALTVAVGVGLGGGQSAHAAPFFPPVNNAEKCAFMASYDAAHHEAFSLSHWTGSQWVGVTCP